VPASSSVRRVQAKRSTVIEKAQVMMTMTASKTPPPPLAKMPC
jgi:hypothetical protein